MKVLMEWVDRQATKDREIADLRNKLSYTDKVLACRDNEVQQLTEKVQ